MLRQGDVLMNRYQLMEKIGQGGTGIIYKAYDLNLQKYVVVKKIKDNFVDSLNNRAEVDILKKLNHQYLPQVYDFIVVERQVFTVMDFIDGCELKHYQDFGYTIDERTLKRWLEQLLEVLDYLHSQNPKIIHSDIKPANIMITRENNVCLIDFNISLGDGDTSSIYGISEHFAAPEQKEKARLATMGCSHQHILLDEQTDIYSLGKSIRAQMEYGTGKGIIYTETLWEIINKSIMPEREDRYASAKKMLYAVQNMEKLDKDYQKLWMTKLLVHFSYAVCVIVSVFLIYYGYTLKEKEGYQESLRQLKVYAEINSSNEMVSEGIELLNSSYYKKREKMNPEEAAYIMHTVGEGYFLSEDYAEAAKYYELAIQVSENQVEDQYYADYAIAKARKGLMESALLILEDAKEHGVDNEYLCLIQSEIYIYQGKYESAQEVLEQIVEKSVSSELEIKVLRRLGYLYSETGRLGDSLTCYKKLCGKVGASFEDWMNYAICYEAFGDDSAGLKVLQRIEHKYPEKYEIPMHMAFMYYRSGEKSLAVTYYRKAKKLYVGESDSLMKELGLILER